MATENKDQAETATHTVKSVGNRLEKVYEHLIETKVTVRVGFVLLGFLIIVLQFAF